MSMDKSLGRFYEWMMPWELGCCDIAAEVRPDGVRLFGLRICLQ